MEREIHKSIFKVSIISYTLRAGVILIKISVLTFNFEEVSFLKGSNNFYSFMMNFLLIVTPKTNRKYFENHATINQNFKELFVKKFSKKKQ